MRDAQRLTKEEFELLSLCDGQNELEDGELASVNEKCGSCKYFKYCAGGCRAIALTLTGDKMGVDLAKCLFFGKGYYETIKR